MSDNFPNLFYLIGFQRSGTTVLCHLLDKHPELVCVEEPEVSKRIVYGQLDLLRDSSFNSIKMPLQHYGGEIGEYIKLVDRYLAAELDEDSFIKCVYSLFNLGGAKCIGAKEVIDLTSDKYDYFNRLLDFHRKNLKIIFLERDIKGVVHSFVKMGFFPNEVFFIPRGRKKINSVFMKMFARKYSAAIGRVLSLLQQVDYVHLFYEDLLENPFRELEKIYRFLGVDASRETLEYILNTASQGIRCNYSGIAKETAAGWEKGLSFRQIAWLDKFAGKVVSARTGRLAAE